MRMHIIRLSSRQLAAATCALSSAALLACGGDSSPSQAREDVGDDVFFDAGRDTADTSDVAVDTEPPPCEAVSALTASGVRFTMPCNNTVINLRPSAYFDGEWVSAVACTPVTGALICPIANRGRLRLEAGETNEWIVTFEALADVRLGGIRLSGTTNLPGATTWMSNGFQSWSQSGVVALGAAPTAAALTSALTRRGDEEVLRDGTALSWDYTFVAGGEHAIVLAATETDGFRHWAQATRSGTEVAISIAAGGTGATIPVGINQTFTPSPFYIRLGDDLNAMLVDYADQLTYFDGSAEPELGWNSWYDLWDTVDALAVLANAPIARSTLDDASAQPLRIVIDDGWQNDWGDWTPNAKFPDGIDGLAEMLHADGFEVGLWFAPLLVAADSQLVADNPNWFVVDTRWNHLSQGQMAILDPTHPEAAAHLTDVITEIVSWDIDFLKIDFLFAGTFEGGRAEDVTGMQAYERALQVIRAAAGDDVTLLAVGSPGMDSFPYVDGWRMGPDIAVENFDVSWFFMPNEIRAMAARWMYCSHTLCDSDPALLRGLQSNEVQVGVWTAALGGGAFFLSDDLRELSPSRLSVNADAVRNGISGQAFVPIDLVPSNPPRTLTSALADQIAQTNQHVVPTQWNTPLGQTLRFNLTDTTADINGQSVPARSVHVE